LITTGAKLWLAITAIALVAAEAYFLGTGGDDGGAITLLFVAVGAATIGAASIAARDGDVAEDADVESVAMRTALPAPWPALGALGAGIAAVGLAVGGVLFYLGIGVVVVTLVEWMVSSWAERSTADPAYNQALRNRIMFPVEVPALGLLGVGFIILSFSRVLLALPDKNVSTVIAIVVATLITAVAFLVAYRPRIGSGALSWMLAIAAVVLLGAGIVGGVAGEREIEHHEAEHVEGDHPDEGVAGEGDESEGGEGTIADDGSHDDEEEPSE
jgi:hypothetical protein